MQDVTSNSRRVTARSFRRRLVLEALYDRPIVSVNDVRTLTGTTYAAANSLVARLVKLGVLAEMTGYARNRRFRYAPYIALFASAVEV